MANRGSRFARGRWCGVTFSARASASRLAHAMHGSRLVRVVPFACIASLAIACSSSGGQHADGAVPGGAADRAVPDASDPCGPLSERAQALLDVEQEASLFTGMVFGLLTPRCGATMAASGLVLRDPETPMEADRIMTVSSVAKTFLAVVVLQLVEEGALSLEDPVATWMADVPSSETMTVRHVLGHRSGLRDHWVTPCITATTPRDLVRCISLYGLMFAPGSGYYYSNTGYVLLGLIVEAVTGNTLHAEIRTRVIDPLGLTNTMFLGDPMPPAREMHTYAGAADVTGQEDPLRTWACADMLADADDLLRFFRDLFTGDLLTRASLEAMTAFSPTDGFPPGAYGLGLVGDVIRDDAGQPLYRLWGNGGRGDAMNDCFYIPELDSVSVLFVNERYDMVNIWVPDEIHERLVRGLGPLVAGL